MRFDKGRKSSWMWGSILLLLLAGQEELPTVSAPASDVRIEVTFQDTHDTSPVRVEVGRSEAREGGEEDAGSP